MNRKQMVAMLGSCGIVGSLGLAGCGGMDSQCDASGHACTWLGEPEHTAFNKDGHDRLSTALYWSMDMLFAHDGTAWFIDWNNHLVRKVTAQDKVVSVVGSSDPIFPGDGDPTDPTAEYSPQGAPGGDVQLNHPTDLYELPDGMILIMAWHNHKLRKLDPRTGNVWVIAGGAAGFAGDGGPASAALFKQPSRLALDEQQNIYILDQQNERIRKIDAQTQIITTVAGNGKQGFAGDGGPALAAQLSWAVGDNPEPSGGLVYHAGTLYISDTDNNRIRSVDLQSGIITTLAGTGQGAYGGDGGPATAAMLFHPRDLEIGPDGDLYVADTDNGRVRAINLTTGLIRTVAGIDKMGFDHTEGQLAMATELNRPFSVDFDAEGNLYVSDTINSRIVRVAR
jgi:DNA-binding beta-propeller fold protein YncE